MSIKSDKALELTHVDQLFLESRWMDDYQEFGRKDNAKRWFEAVLYTLNFRGDIIVPAIVMDFEKRVLQAGLAEEYIEQVLELVPSAPIDIDDYSLVLYTMLSMSPSVRLEALTNLLKKQPQGVLDASELFEAL